ncbi:MAG: VCBS repeat-containing protein, partial [Saprospiraceae bacterium]|nr:VCBS repeat-containing protein [Saprospiraceae bacterium]
MFKLRFLSLFLIIIACNTSEKNEVRKSTELSDQSLSGVAETELFTLLSPAETNIDFKNIVTENNNFNFKSYAYIYNGSGVAIGDINNDGMQDVFLGGNMVSGKMYLNLGDFKFKDITKASGLENIRGFRTGVNMADVNGDGHIDIYVCAGGRYTDDFRKNLLYINNGNSTFTEKAAEYGLADMSYSTQSYFLDIDNDGDLDLYLLNHPPDPKESNNLRLENDKNGKPKIALSPNLTFITDRLYRNDNGKFKDITEKSGILNEAFGLSADVADFNEDGFADIYVCNDYVKPDNLYINNGDGTFTDKFNDYFQHTSFSSMGSDFADINNDGCLDLMTLDMFPEDNFRQKMHGTEYNYDKYLLTKKLNIPTQFIKNTLQINNCNGTFSDIALMAGVAHTDWSWTTLMADYDNDGWKDIFVTNGYRRSVIDNDYVKYTQDSLFKQIDRSTLNIDMIINAIPVHKTKSYLFKNNANLTFTDVSATWNAGPPEFSNGAVYVDLNNDGYLDMVSNNIDEAPFIYKNNGLASRKNNFVRIDLKAEKGKTAFGTKVELTDESGMTQTQYFYPSRGFLSSVEPIIHFGLGNKKTIKEAKIFWPNGRMQTVTDLKLNSLNTITYSAASEKSPKLVNANLYFEDITEKSGLDYAHQENEYIDFKREPLLHRKFSDEGPTVATGDVNNDGLDDIYFGGSTGFEGKLYLQQKNGKFKLKPNEDFVNDKVFEDVGSIFIDVNGDKNNDLIVVSGGNEFPLLSPNYQDRLYLNDGSGNFKRADKAMPAILSSGSTISAHDIDGDGDLDIFRGGRVASGQYPTAPMSYLARNDKGVFVNVTPEWSDGIFKAGMVTASTFADIDNDKIPELIICGDWMPVMVFKLIDKKYKNITEELGLSKDIGWWESVAVTDLNNDGFPEIIAGNAGLNTHTKASNEKPVTIHYKDYDGNKSLDAILCYYNGEQSYPIAMRDRLLDQMIVLKKKFLRYRNYAGATLDDIFTKEQRKGEEVLSANNLASMVYYNNQGKSFTGKQLPVSAQISCIRGIVTGQDINKDGFSDVITAGNFYGTEVLLGRYDSSVGNVFLNDGKGNLKTVTPSMSGFNANGDVRHIAKVKTNNGDCILIVRNNDKA